MCAHTKVLGAEDIPRDEAGVADGNGLDGGEVDTVIIEWTAVGKMVNEEGGARPRRMEGTE